MNEDDDLLSQDIVAVCDVTPSTRTGVVAGIEHPRTGSLEGTPNANAAIRLIAALKPSDSFSTVALSALHLTRVGNVLRDY